MAGDDKVAKLEEVPETWGLLVASGSQLRTVKKAPRLQPIPADRQFLSNIFRRASQASEDTRKLQEARNAGYLAAEQEFKRRQSQELSEAKESLEKCQALIDEFEQASGLSLYETRPFYKWGNCTSTDLGHAVKRVLNGDLDRKTISHCRDQVSNIVERLSEILEETTWARTPPNDQGNSAAAKYL